MRKKPEILIIEDDEETRRELGEYLSRAGYDTAFIGQFSDVAKKALKEAPDLILLDVNLPGINGLHICEQIRQTSQIPIIFVTGNNTSMDELNCMLRGGDDYVAKPYQLPVLMARIAAVLRRTMREEETEDSRREYKGVSLDLAAAQIRKEDRQRLEQIADEVMVRENIGYDVTAYREGILKPGFEKLSQYDEVVICNDTMYGPLYPFSEMFETMAARDLDFWGITNFHEVPFDPFGTIVYGYIPTHIQSFFMVFRQSLVKSREFQEYWTNFPTVHNYEEAIGYHEAIFTKKFSDLGYRWEVYADSTDLEGYTYDPLRDFPRYLVEEKRCPVIKKRSFYHEYGEAMERSGGEATREVLDYVEKHLSYDTGLIWKNLLRTQNQADLKKRMHWNFVLSSRRKKPSGNRKKLRLALILHIYYDDLAAYCRRYAEQMPEGTDVYITVPDEKKLKAVQEAFDGFPYHTEYRVTGNLGRDVAPFIVGCKDVVDQLDLIC